ncbi:MAG: hypothetical protein AAF721_14575 [Myxococcota bacterium]
MAPARAKVRARSLLGAVQTPAQPHRRGRNPPGAASGILRHGSIALTAGLLVGVAGCTEPERATLVAVPGCGLDSELAALRVQTRGDFPAGDATQVVIDGGLALVGENVGDVAGITVEGLFGDLASGVGRSARLRESGEIPIYFSAVDRLCDVQNEGAVVFRQPGAVAAAPLGDVVAVGGLDAFGELVDGIVHVNDERGTPRQLGPRLPEPAIGQSVHAVGPREFLVVGGAGAGSEALDTVTRMEFGGGGEFDLGRPEPFEVPLQPQVGRAYHGAATMVGGFILVTGGCTAVGEQGACVPSETSVLSTSFLIDATNGSVDYQRAPPLLTARYAHTMHVARDGVVFAVGGLNPAGEALLDVDVLRDRAGEWEPYGPPLRSELPDTASIEGSALLDGGLLALSVNDGTIRWVNSEQSGVFEEWCDPTTDGPCFFGVRDALRQPGPRPLTVLPGERVIADHFVLPVFSPGQTGADAIDLSFDPPGSLSSRPQQRTGALPIALADGTVLLAGGFSPTENVPLSPFALRFRPQLDGPDEGIPPLSDLSAGSLIAIEPDRVTADGMELRLASVGSIEEFPNLRARVRGFRSRSFRFDATLSADETVYPHVVLEYGALTGLSVRFGPQIVRGSFRDATGSIVEFSCGSLDENFWDSTQVLQVTVRPESFIVSQGDTTLVQCPVPAFDGPVTVGIGASGDGVVTATALRLTRI